MKRKQCSFDITFVVVGKERISPEQWEKYLKKYFISFSDVENAYDTSVTFIDNYKVKICAWGCLKYQTVDETNLTFEALAEALSKDGYAIWHKASFFFDSDDYIDEKKLLSMKEEKSLPALLEENEKLKGEIWVLSHKERELNRLVAEIETIIDDNYWFEPVEKLQEIESAIDYYRYSGEKEQDDRD